MKLAVVSMIRDEADILPAFLRHIAAVFDTAYLFDHRSSDGSGEALRQFCSGRAGFSYFLLDCAGRHQRQVSMLGMQRAFAAGADAVLFLDADEFLKPSRAEIEAQVRRLDAEGAVGMLDWLPCYPQSFAGSFDPHTPLWVAKTAAQVSKVVIPRSVFVRARGHVPLAEGNHFVEWGGDRAPQRCVGQLYHVPLRSRPQVVRKAMVGAIAHLAKTNSMRLEGYQQRELIDLVAEGRLDDVALASMARTYAEPPRTALDPPREFTLRPLDVALAAEPVRLAAGASDLRVIAGALRGVQFELHDKPALCVAGHVVSIDPRMRAAGVHELQAAFARQTDELGSVRFLTLRLMRLLGARAMRMIAAWVRVVPRPAGRQVAPSVPALPHVRAP